MSELPDPGAMLQLGDEVLKLHLTELDYEWVTPAVRISLVVNGVPLHVPNKETLPGVEHFLTTTINQLRSPISCKVNPEHGALQAFTDLFYVSQVFGFGEPLDERHSALVTRIPAGSRSTKTSASTFYNVSDLLGGISAQPIGYGYILCWSPIAHVAVLGHHGEFTSLSLPTEEMAIRFSAMEGQVEEWMSAG